MPTKWGDIKNLLGYMEPASQAGTVGFQNGTVGFPKELQLYARMTNNEIAGNPHKFRWLLRSYDLALNGATSYDLATLIPDLGKIYQIHGAAISNREAPWQDNNFFNIMVGGYPFRWTLESSNLLFGDQSVPSNVTVPILYYSTALVLDKDLSTRKMDFEDDDDTSVIPDIHVMSLVEGITRFIYRKERREQYKKEVALFDGRIVNVDPFLHLVTQMVQDDSAVAQSVKDLRR